VTEKYFYTGEKGISNSKYVHYGCYEDPEAPAAECKKADKDYVPLLTTRTALASGNRCGYSFYVVHCGKK
jgi:hypothetical protein